MNTIIILLLVINIVICIVSHNDIKKVLDFINANIIDLHNNVENVHDDIHLNNTLMRSLTVEVSLLKKDDNCNKSLKTCKRNRWNR